MSLKSLLEGWQFPPLRLPRPERTTALARRVGTPLHPPRPQDLDRLHREVREAWDRDRSLQEFPPRLLRRLPWVLFHPPGGPPGEWLGSDEQLFTAYRRYFLAQDSALLVLRFLAAFLQAWPQESCPLFDRWCEMLADAIRQSTGPALEPWRRRQRELDLVSRRGPSRLARHLLETDAPPGEELARWGLGHALANLWGFLDATLLAACDLVGEPGLPGTFAARLERVLSLLHGPDGRALRFPARAPAYVSRLLAPCLAADSPCVGEVRDRLLAFALDHLKDPRVSRKHWTSIPGELLELVLRWLAEESIELFLEMISRHAVRHQWEERRRLWKKHLGRGTIDEAWVVLGADPATDLRVRCREQRIRMPRHGRLRGASSDQSVLLLKMRGWTIAEWSHNGACRFYDPASRTAPRLYRQEYLADEIRAPGYAERIVHQGQEWVSAIDRYIRQEILP